MKNRYGLDSSYFKGKLELILRDLENYKPDEIARELARLSATADKDVIHESEFEGKCDHRFMHFGSQKFRRCASCNKIENQSVLKT